MIVDALVLLVVWVVKWVVVACGFEWVSAIILKVLGCWFALIVGWLWLVLYFVLPLVY